MSRLENRTEKFTEMRRKMKWALKSQWLDEGLMYNMKFQKQYRSCAILAVFEQIRPKVLPELKISEILQTERYINEVRKRYKKIYPKPP